MKTLRYTFSNSLTKFHDELCSAVPSLAPKLPDVADPERPDAKEAVIHVEGLGDEVCLTVPDDADEVAIQAVVDAHDATPVVTRGEVLEAKLADDSITFDEMKELMRLRG